MPEKLRNSIYQKNINENKRKLVSHFDLYKTIKHFTYLNKNSQLKTRPEAGQALKCRSKYFAESYPKIRSRRGISLFETIPLNRTCQQALIPLSYCNCVQKTALLSESDFFALTKVNYKQIGDFITNELNLIANEFRSKCELFVLEAILSANKLSYFDSEYFEFTLKYQPGNSTFETSILVNDKENNELKIHDRIFRVSRYGTQSSCMTDSKYFGFCFCKKSLK